MTLRSVHPLWHDSCQRTNYALDGQSAVGSALLLGQWWHAATLLHEARSLHPHRASWTAWLREIPVSESHASRLVLIAHSGLASPAFSYREAYALSQRTGRWEKISRRPVPAQTRSAPRVGGA